MRKNKVKKKESSQDDNEDLNSRLSANKTNVAPASIESFKIKIQCPKRLAKLEAIISILMHVKEMPRTCITEEYNTLKSLDHHPSDLTHVFRELLNRGIYSEDRKKRVQGCGEYSKKGGTLFIKEDVKSELEQYLVNGCIQGLDWSRYPKRKKVPVSPNEIELIKEIKGFMEGLEGVKIPVETEDIIQLFIEHKKAG